MPRPLLAVFVALVFGVLLCFSFSAPRAQLAPSPLLGMAAADKGDIADLRAELRATKKLVQAALEKLEQKGGMQKSTKVPATKAKRSCKPLQLSQLSVPSCLGSGVATVVEEERPDCSKYEEMCCRSVGSTPSGVLITLPLFTSSELSDLYANAYTGQKKAKSPSDLRPMAQSAIIRETGRFNEDTSGLTIMEMGCADGFVLYDLRKLAGKGGRIVCFEADPDYSDSPRHLPATFEKAKKDTPGLSTDIHKSLFDPSKVAAKSVDVFTSSHVVEHFADPCTWLQGLRTIMKPGGIIFTEVPNQHSQPYQNITG